VPAETLTPQPAELSEGWHTYTDDVRGFTFDYWCWIEAAGERVEFTDDWANLTLRPANGLDLQTYVGQAIPNLQTHYHYISRSDRPQDHDPEGIVLEGSTIDSRPGILAFFQRDDTIYLFQTRLTILTGCNAQELGVNNPDAFLRTIESFSFTR
jgi:hypothetical protein